MDSDQPKTYLRYIDDIYVVFDNENGCSEFLHILNAQHIDIKFTVEKATKTLTFLDVEITLNDAGYETSVWRKHTNTGVMLNFTANCPLTWKSGSIICLLNRAKSICSNVQLYNDEIRKLRILFHNNSYPNWFFDKVVKKFEQINDNNRSICTQAKTYRYLIDVPYFGKCSKKFAKRLKDLIKTKFNC